MKVAALEPARQVKRVCNQLRSSLMCLCIVFTGWFWLLNRRHFQAQRFEVIAGSCVHRVNRRAELTELGGL
jgi:hypothetical protein